MFILGSPATVDQDVKRSKFRAHAAPIADMDAAKAFIATHSVADANHNCWAWRVGQAYRFSDDGEPSGTAGKPILQAIDGLKLDMVAVVVTRWFGGILLGSGGLIRAYGGTASLCLQAVPHKPVIQLAHMQVKLGFSDLAAVKARLIARPDVQIDGESFIDTGAILDVIVPEADAATLLRLITDMTSGRAVIDIN